MSCSVGGLTCCQIQNYSQTFCNVFAKVKRSVAEASKEIELYSDLRITHKIKVITVQSTAVSLRAGGGRLTGFRGLLPLSSVPPPVSQPSPGPRATPYRSSCTACGHSTRCSVSRWRGSRGRTCGRESSCRTRRTGLVLHGEFWPDACDGIGVCRVPLDAPSHRHVACQVHGD